MDLRLKGTRTFGNGVVLLHYSRDGAQGVLRRNVVERGLNLALLVGGRHIADARLAIGQRIALQYGTLR
jgi:hypothetical protein